MSAARYRPLEMRVDLEAIRHNARRMVERLDGRASMIAVVKADGYGHGAVETGRAALEAGASMLAVAIPEEAIALRQAGIQSDILVLGDSPLAFLEAAARFDIILTAHDSDWIERAARGCHRVRVHMKLDTGMGRIGLRDSEEVDRAIGALRASRSLVLDGAYTHFSTADDPKSAHYAAQKAQFAHLLARFPEKPRLLHASNSAAALLDDQVRFDAVRFGISLYGIPPAPSLEAALPFALEPAMSLATALVQVKRVPAGSPVGYGCRYIAPADEWIGTLPLGYADGWIRRFTGMDVLVRGERCPIVGNICMDQCMVRLPGPANVGEEVVLIGWQGEDCITLWEAARYAGTIAYEIPCLLTARVPRIYC